MTNCKPNELVAGEPHRAAQWNKTHTICSPELFTLPSLQPIALLLRTRNSKVPPCHRSQPIAGGPILIRESSRAIKSSEKWHPRLVPPCSDGLEGFVVVGLFSPDTLVHRQCEHGSRDQSAPLNRSIHRFRPHIRSIGLRGCAQG